MIQQGCAVQVDRPHPIDELLQPAVPELLQGLTDSDRWALALFLHAADCHYCFPFCVQSHHVLHAHSGIVPGMLRCTS